MRREISIALALGLLVMLFAASPTPSREARQNDSQSAPQLSEQPGRITLTIYQDQNLALIEDRRVLELTKGLAPYEIRGLSEKLIPDSVKIESLELPEVLQLVEQRFENDPLTLGELLKAHLGQEIEVFAPGGLGTYRGKLVGVEGAVILQETSGELRAIGDATRFGFPPRALKGPALLWRLKSEIAGPHPVRLSYLSEGLNWQASHTAVLDSDAGRLDLESWISVSNSSEMDFEQAELRLVAGRIHRAEERKGFRAVEALAEAPEAGFEERPAFEYHLYELRRPATLPKGQTVQLAFLQAESIPTEIKYIYEAHVWDGVQVWVEFDNDALLGKPLPAGMVRLYQKTSEGLQFIGEDRIGHTPLGERVKLLAGLAFDLVAKRVQMSHERLGDRRWRDSFQIVLTNRKAKDVVIYVRERLRGDWKIKDYKPQFVKLDAQTIEFRVPLAAGETTIVQYTVEYGL